MPQFHDELVTAGSTDPPTGFFDRFMFNLHPAAGIEPAVILGFGVYPGRDVADGYLGLVFDGSQRNVRFSTTLSAAPGDGAGPMSYDVVEPGRVWRLVVGANPTGVELDARWTARTPAWTSTVEVANTTAETTSFEHLVQSGRWEGRLQVDGRGFDLTGWFGQRDRSRGVRTMSGGQGLHLWFQAQFPDRTVSLLMVEDREGGLVLAEGAVCAESGDVDDVAGVGHDLVFDDGLDLRSGTVDVHTAAGHRYRIDVDASARGMYMAGLGYGGWHGRPHGVDHLEHDTYALDGSVTPRTLAAPLTDRFARFDLDGEPGGGVVEFAHSRSGSYTYRPRPARSTVAPA